MDGHGPTDHPGLAVTPLPDDLGTGWRARAGRALRWLAAVDEDLLRWVPSERAKYTALGGIVLGTATIAAFSMLTALSQVRDGFHVFLLLPMLIWGAFVCNLDRWLVSTSAGASWHRRASILLPRLLLAFLFGCVIAEPIVLRVFDSAIVQHIRDGRQEDLLVLESTLLRCNPDPTAGEEERRAANTPDCADNQLNLQASFAAMSQELANRQQEATTLRDTIAAESAEQARRDTLASNECAGTPGPGTTGTAGRGEECLTREREAEEYRKSHPTARHNERLEELSTQISTLQAGLNTAQQDYQGRRDAEVKQKVDEREENQGPIGLLERFSALDDLTNDNAFLFVATWFIRLFFITVDCLPVLVKLISGVTRYDEIVDARLAGARRVFEQGIKTSETAIVSDLKGRQEDVVSRAKMRRATSEHDLRWHQAQLDVELDQQIGVLADKLRTPHTTASNDTNGAVAPGVPTGSVPLHDGTV